MTDLISLADAIAIVEDEMPGHYLSKQTQIITKLRDLPAAHVAVKPLTWDFDGRSLRLDESMMMGKGYDWEGYECLRQEGMQLGHAYIIWPGHILSSQWNVYGVSDGLYIQDCAGEAGAKAAAETDWQTKAQSILIDTPAPDPAQIMAATPPAVSDVVDKEDWMEGLTAWEVGNEAFAQARKGMNSPAVSDDVAALVGQLNRAVYAEAKRQWTESEKTVGEYDDAHVAMRKICEQAVLRAALARLGGVK